MSKKKNVELYYCSNDCTSWIHVSNFNSCINDVANAAVSLKIAVDRKVYVLFLQKWLSFTIEHSENRPANQLVFIYTLLYGRWLSAHCLFSLSQFCDNFRHWNPLKRNTEKLNLAKIALKRPQTPWKQKLYTQQEKVSRFYYFFSLFWTIP